MMSRRSDLESGLIIGHHQSAANYTLLNSHHATSSSAFQARQLFKHGVILSIDLQLVVDQADDVVDHLVRGHTKVLWGGVVGLNHALERFG